MRIPSSIPHYPNFSRLLHPSSHNHVQGWFELRCRPWRESGVGVWPDEGDCGSDVFQVSFSYPILKARDWLNGGTLSWRLVVRWKVRLVQWREVWPCEWRWAQNIRGIAKKKQRRHHVVSQLSLRLVYWGESWAFWKKLSPSTTDPSAHFQLT